MDGLLREEPLHKGDLMSIRLRLSTAALGAAALFSAAVMSGEAFAQASVLKECGAQYQAAKAANELNGQTWQEYLKACRARLAEPAAAPAPPPAAPAPAPAAAPPPPPPPAPAPAPAAAPAPAPSHVAPPAPAAAATPTPASGGRAALTAREKQCGAEWKEKKADLRKAAPKATWPKFWSACNTRLKAQGQ